MIMGQGRGGGAQAQQIFSNFWDNGDWPKFLTEEAVVGNFFSPFIIKGSIVLWIFFIKEDYLNYFMLEESLPAYLLYKNTLYRTFIINGKVKCFQLLSQQQLLNFNEKFNLSLTGKLPLFLYLAVQPLKSRLMTAIQGRGVASFWTSCRPGWLSFPHILKIARMTI